MSSNLPVSIDALVGGLTRTIQRQAMSSPDGMAFLKLAKGGFWIYGADDIEVLEKSLWAVNPTSFAVGFIAWKSSEVKGEQMVSVTADPIIEADLPDVGAEWSAQVSMQLVCVSGEDKGEKVLYKSSARGGKKRFSEFLQQVLIQLSSGEGGDKVVPVITLECDSYKHKDWGTIYQPIFKIDSWRTLDDTLDDEQEPEAAPEQEPEPEPEPAPRSRKRAPRKAAAEPDSESTEPEPDGNTAEPEARPRRARRTRRTAAA